MNKRGGFTDLFIMIIFVFVIALIVGVFIFIGNETVDQLHASMDTMDLGDGSNNASEVIDNTMGAVSGSYAILRWVSILIFFAMILGIFIGSYLVRTKPVWFIAYIFVTIIAIVVSVVTANAYNTLIQDATLSSTYATMTAINWFMLNLPMIITVVGIAGGLIMFSQLGRREAQYYGYQ
jgi:hypothetical protein